MGKRLHLMKHGKIKPGRKHCRYVHRFIQPWLWNFQVTSFWFNTSGAATQHGFLPAAETGPGPIIPVPPLGCSGPEPPRVGGQQHWPLLFAGMLSPCL